MRTTKRSGVARPDQECLEAWDRIMAIARDHALIVSAYGGTAALATPARQREYEVRETVLRAHDLEETTEEAT